MVTAVGYLRLKLIMFFQIKLNMFVDDFVHCDKPLVEASVLKQSNDLLYA